MIKITNSEKETQKIAQEFTTTLSGGEALLLIGDLGSGKTAFTKGLAKGLGVTNTITSPTFVLMKNYKGKKYKLVHVDAYRLEDGQGLIDIGIEEFFNDDECVTVIEWADKVQDIWPKSRIIIEFRVVGDDKREIKIK